jgi:carbamoyl-phosphate synthase large subunit
LPEQSEPAPPSKLNVLITCAGRKVAIVDALRRAMRQLGIEGAIVGTDASPMSATLQVCDYRYLVPPASDPAYIPTLLSLCREHEIGLLLPLIDVDLLALAEQREAFIAVGVTPLISQPEVIRICRDKRATQQFFEQHHIPAARTISEQELAAGSVSYPLFIKPYNGSGSINSFKVMTEEELRFFLQYVPEPLVQEYATGQEYTIDALVDLNGRIINVVPRRRIEVRAGEISKGVTAKDWRIMGASITLLETLNAVGPITLQCFVDQEHIRFTEINPRVGGGLPLTIAAGADYALQIVQMALGMRVEPCVGQFVDDYYMFRYEEAIYVGGDELRQITQARSL